MYSDTIGKHKFSVALRNSKLLVVLLAMVLFTSFFTGRSRAADEKKSDLKRGKELYAVCSACHGVEAHGNQAIKAPALAGLTDWYIQEQVKKFQNGQRGAHPADATGLLMRPMARTLKNDKEVAAVAAYIVSLKPVLPEITIEGGDAAAGQALFAVCVACHGDKLQGNEQLKTAPLKYSNDWYQLAQLKKYKAHVRGNDPEDAQALQMQAIVAGLPDEQTMKNVIAYISQVAKK